MKQTPCGCCEGVSAITPESVTNRQGLSWLHYRVGTHATFLETMVARLTSMGWETPADTDETAPIWPLQDLKTREPSDPSIALLDAWATVADVLTFYQEQFANEGFLDTATERRSILELARLIGYRLRPGVASSVYLAFGMDDGYEEEIPAGTRAQSIPGVGELPQAFETSEIIDARSEWNTIRPRLTQPQLLEEPISVIYLDGVTRNLKTGDPLLVATGSVVVFKRVRTVELDTDNDRTKVVVFDVAMEVARMQALVVAGVLLLKKLLDMLGEMRFGETQIGELLIESILRALETTIEALSDERKSFREQLHAIRLFLPLLGEILRFAQNYGETIADVEERALYQSLVDWVEQVKRTLEIAHGNLAPMTEGSKPISDRRVVHVGSAVPFKKPRKPVDAIRGDRWEKVGEPAFKAVKTNVTALRSALRKGGEPDLLYVSTQAEIIRLGVVSRILAALELETDWVETQHEALKEMLEGDLGVKGSNGGWESFIDTLLIDPNRMPASGRYLKRDFAETYDHATDMVPRILEEIEPSLEKLYDARKSVDPTLVPAGVYALRMTSALFGHNVKDQVTYRTTDTAGLGPRGAPELEKDWEPWEIADDEREDNLFLDGAHDIVLPGSYIAIKTSTDSTRAYSVGTADIHVRSEYGLSLKATEVTLGEGESWRALTGDKKDDFRRLVRAPLVYGQSELLDLAEEPVEDHVTGETIELNGLYSGLESGRWLIVSGELVDAPGAHVSELVMIAAPPTEAVRTAGGQPVPGDTAHTTISLANNGLAHTYKRDTVTIYGNVVKATHGETRTQVLGSGDASKSFQIFELQHKPLTHVSAITASGTESALEVRVNKVKWHESGSLTKLTPIDRRFITRTNDEDVTSVVFGNGRNGNRLPTGVENVEAVYRNGIGSVGNVGAKQISQLATKPLGVKDVINPRAATGGADRETRDQARSNAPLSMMALDRIVSVQDYADFSRTFGGVGKASAVELSDGRRELIHVTIAGVDDTPVDDTSDLIRNLEHALLKYGDPYQPVQVAVRRLKLLVLDAAVKLHPDYLWDSVEPTMRQALLDRFSFARAELGGDVFSAEIVATIQGVKGVTYVDLNRFDAITATTDVEVLRKSIDGLESKPKARVIVELADYPKIDPVESTESTELTESTAAKEIAPAQVAYFNGDLPDTIILSEITT